MRHSRSTRVWFIIYYLAISASTASVSNTEKAIKSLETTLERKFNQLIAVVNATCTAPEITVKQWARYVLS